VQCSKEISIADSGEGLEAKLMSMCIASKEERSTDRCRSQSSCPVSLSLHDMWCEDVMPGHSSEY